MRAFLICVEGTSYISVEAETPEDAKQSALDIFLTHRADDLNVQIISEKAADI